MTGPPSLNLTAAPHRPEPVAAPAPAAHFDLPQYLPQLRWLFGFDGKPPSPRTPYWRQNIFRRVIGDQVYLLTTWWPEELGKVSFVLPVTLTAVLASRTASDPQAWDRRTARRLHSWSTGWVRDLGEFLSQIGESRYALLIIGGTYAGSRWTGNERIERCASLSVEALFNTSIYVGFLKKASRRTRPVGGGTGEFFVSDPPPGQSNGSYPSGHATGIFAVATVFALEFEDNRWAPWVSYATAGLIALSRVTLGRHFPTDVVTGAILGNSIGRMVSHRSDSHAAGLDPMWAPADGVTPRD